MGRSSQTLVLPPESRRAGCSRRRTAAEANRTGDSFILVTVIMASVMFFAGVGTKLKGKTTRVTMLIIAGLLCAGAIAAMLSLPQRPVDF